MPRVLAAVILVVLLIAGTSHSGVAALQNPGFETGGFAGWNDPANPPGGSLVMEADVNYYGIPYGPFEGRNFARLIAGSPDVPTIVWQKVHLVAGERLAGMATFKAFDLYASELPSWEYNDWAAVRIYGGSHDNGSFGNDWLAQPWYRDVFLVGDFGGTPWQPWSWNAIAEGDYYLWYGVANTLDAIQEYSSRAGFDTVPLTPSLLLFATGLITLFSAKKMRRLRRF